MSEKVINIGDLVHVWPLDEEAPIIGTVVGKSYRKIPAWKKGEWKSGQLHVNLVKSKEAQYEVQFSDNNRVVFPKEQVFAEGETPVDYETLIRQALVRRTLQEIDDSMMAEVQSALDLYEGEELCQKFFKK